MDYSLLSIDPWLRPGNSVESNFRAKRLGRTGQLRPDWEEVKYSVMRPGDRDFGV